MTVKEFLKDFNYAPYSLEEVAELARRVVDNNELRWKANKMLETREEFKHILEDIGFEQG